MNSRRFPDNKELNFQIRPVILKKTRLKKMILGKLAKALSNDEKFQGKKVCMYNFGMIVLLYSGT